MRLMPKDKAGKISFCKSHLNAWVEHAEELGVSQELIAELVAKVQASELAYREQIAAEAAMRSKTATANSAIASMADLAATIILQIRSHSRTAGRQLYSLALLPPPQKGSPIAEPGQPTRFTLEARQAGTVELRWSCKNPRGSVGTMYEVRRKIGMGPGEFEFLGAVGEKRFVDETIPSGTASVVYEVQAFRSTKRGQVASYTFSFGTDDATRQLLKKMMIPRAA